MLVSEVKKNMSKGKDLIDTNNPNLIIESIIEKPLQKACIRFKEKNIQTCMSSANKKNILKDSSKRVSKNDILNGMNHHRPQTFFRAGKGYAWIMLNYNTLSDENKEILFNLKDELGEDIILFANPSFANFYKNLQKKLKLNDVILSTGDKYDEIFERNKIVFMYNTNMYPGRSVFIRMPIDSKTTIEDVENYYDKIIDRLLIQ